MSLPIAPGYAPMEARIVAALPTGPHWQYEPKWDGFRCLAFRDGPSVELRSKSGQSLTRYFPEIAAAVKELPARRFVLDGEIVVPTASGLSFDALLLRIHPAQSRVRKLAAETPAVLLAFDLLVDARGRDLTSKPLAERRERLEAFAAENFGESTRVQLSPATRALAQAKQWLAGRAGTDGVMAKRLDATYRSGERTAMDKIKRKRTADCVVGGFRYGSKSKIVGSLLLGLYDDAGLLHHVGFTSSLSTEERKRITPKLEKLGGGAGFTGRAPGGPSRWSTSRSGEWVALEPTLVVEVEYDHFTNGRFRHGTKFLRWRPEKAPAQCTFDQVAEARGPAKKSPQPRAKTTVTRRASRRRTSSGPARAPHRR
ncbi:MAG TPA: ATP-dependent DNA ligase [Gemmatimonadaceae bacterium]|nr:ATP-dependent DNA ligase [Gemmatimonadaceae bacterium]